MLSTITKELRANSSKQRALKQAKYFKTGPKEYGEGDLFLGLTVPAVRLIAKKYKVLDLSDVYKLASSKYHEDRLCALLILNHKYQFSSTDLERKEIFELWLKLLSENKVNNWDLIDVSAQVVGEILSRHIGYNAAFIHGLAKSNNLWERRAAIMLTFPLIKINKYGPTFAVARDLLSDSHDLIHKACGWMLREVGKRDKSSLQNFIDKHYFSMPRTMLRYAIEKFSPEERLEILNR